MSFFTKPIACDTETVPHVSPAETFERRRSVLEQKLAAIPAKRERVVAELRPLKAAFDQECAQHTHSPLRGTPNFPPALLATHQAFCAKQAEYAEVAREKENLERELHALDDEERKAGKP